MSSPLEPSSSKQEDIETMSNYAESYLSDYEVDQEELQNEKMLFEKPRGERRWLGKEHHRGKERLHNSVKDRTFIEKTVKATEPLSKNATKKINASTRDGLEFNVVYSLDKKNRWKTADTISLLRATPENLNAEVVEKNALEACGIAHSEKSTFAVHSKQVNMGQEPGEFEVRSATSSGNGQHYSNFLPQTREFSKKANARMMTIRGEEQTQKTSPASQPTISYNIYKTHPSQEVVGSQMFKSKPMSKSARHRPGKGEDLAFYEDEDDYDYDAEDFEEETSQRQSENFLDLASLSVGNRVKQERKSKRKDSELSYEIVEAVEPEFSYLLNIQEYLREEGYMFEQADVLFHNQKDNIEHQIKELQQEKKLVIKDLKPRQYLIDVSKWCQLDGGVVDGETTTVIVVSHIKKNIYNVLVNSTIANHPSKKGSEYLRKQISSAMTIREAITRITSEILINRKIVETMKMYIKLFGKKTFSELLHDCNAWENQMVNMNWPNQHYHATWANSEELSNVGTKQDWNDLCAMVKKESQLKTGYTSDDNCGLCSKPKKSHELFLVDNESKIKCTECLRDEFYRELRARRLPIDLQTDTADELEYLPTFIPLTVVNWYIRMVSETIFKDLGASESFGKCPSCKSALFFDDTPAEKTKIKIIQNRSCPCGYSWCKHCDREPHWPMKCNDYTEWEEKWLLRYSMMHAQGSGTETLLQVACTCAKQMYNVLLPEEFMACPRCKLNVKVDTMQTFWKHHYFPFAPVFRKLVVDGHNPFTGGWNGIPGDNYHEIRFAPRVAVCTDVVKIPPIKASVMEICGAARDVRFDLHFRNRAVQREHILIRKKVMETEVVENLFGTSAYLVEIVTAWMYMTNYSDKNVKSNLESMLEDRRALVKTLEGEDSAAITESVKKLIDGIESVKRAVDKKTSNLA
ncbi:unnamed protein product [Caenorhabditis brenneri]